MEASSPEIAAARAVVVFALERFIRERSNWIITLGVIVSLLFVFGVVQSDGFGAIFIGLLALVAITVTATLYITRKVVIGGIRRVGGGRDYPRIRPIVERHINDVERAQGNLKFDTTGLFRLAWMARRPARLQEHVRSTAATLAQAAPRVVADVRRELDARY